MLKNTSHSYGRIARGFHWFSALAVIAALAFIEAKGYFPKGEPLREGLKFAHIQAGVIVLMLLIPRLLWRAKNPPPAITPTPNKPTLIFAHLAHGALYVLMLAIPLLGIAFMQGAGKSVVFFGWVLPTLFTMTPDSAKDLKEIHELLGNILLWLAIFHAAAAVWHHRIVKDDTMTRLVGPIR